MSLAGILSKPQRRVKRVLLMIDFEDQAEGDVYDMTALCGEMFEKATYGARLGFDIKAEYKYDAKVKRALSHFHITFGGDAGEWCSGATHIEDVVNFSLPDGERVQALRKKSARLEKKAEELKRDAMHAKLLQVAEIRHQHPIAKFTMPVELPAIINPTP